MNDAERLAYGADSGGVILKGRSGAASAGRLRQAGYHGALLVDPAAYESSETRDVALFGDLWLEVETALNVVELVSPGGYVGSDDLRALDDVLERESGWVHAAGSGRASVVVHASWLTDNPGRLAALFRAAGVPIAVAFASRNDPLEKQGAVEGLVEVVRAVPNLSILRCDVGAIGAVAHGATMGSIGTSTGVRHVVPPGEHAGGAPNDRSPSVFIPSILDFKLGSLLDSWPRAAVPACEFPCCEGKALTRFRDENSVHEARVHNLQAVQAIVDHVLAAPRAERAREFTNLCVAAEYEVARIETLARRPLNVRPQVSAWARLS